MQIVGEKMRIKRISIIGLLIVLPLMANGQTTDKKGVIYGKVLNGSQDSSAVAGQKVVLYTIMDGKELNNQRPQTVTDRKGRFAFKSLEVGEKIAYYPLTLSEGVEYVGQIVKPGADTLRRQSDIYIFESSTSDSAISASLHHLIVEPSNGFLLVQELYLFANRDNHTYAGNIPAPDIQNKNIVLQMEIPSKATELRLGGDLMSCCVVVKGNQIYDTMPLKPGQRQVLISYRLPYRGQKADLKSTVYQPTRILDVLVAEPIQATSLVVQAKQSDHEEVSGAMNSDIEPVQLKGKSYRRYVAEDVDKGSVFSITMQNLPAAPRDYRWLAPIALLFVFIVGYIVNRRRSGGRQKETEESQSLEFALAKRREMMNQILALDEQYESGALTKQAYRENREVLVDAVLALETEISERKADTSIEDKERKIDDNE